MAFNSVDIETVIPSANLVLISLEGAKPVINNRIAKDAILFILKDSIEIHGSPSVLKSMEIKEIQVKFAQI
jgi:hypothetical protein